MFLKTQIRIFLLSQHYPRLNDLGKRTARYVFGPSDVQSIKQAVHSRAVRDGSRVWQ